MRGIKNTFCIEGGFKNTRNGQKANPDWEQRFVRHPVLSHMNWTLSTVGVWPLRLLRANRTKINDTDRFFTKKILSKNIQLIKPHSLIPALYTHYITSS